LLDETDPLDPAAVGCRDARLPSRRRRDRDCVGRARDHSARAATVEPAAALRAE
jgi:hypothetical protein